MSRAGQPLRALVRINHVTKTIGAILGLRFEYRFEHALGGGPNLIPNRRDPEWAFASPRLQDPRPPHRTGSDRCVFETNSLRGPASQASTSDASRRLTANRPSSAPSESMPGARVPPADLPGLAESDRRLKMVYKIDAESDRKYVEEFRKLPIGTHSPGLQRVLNMMRLYRGGAQYILVCRKRFADYVIGRMPPDRSKPIEIEVETVFKTREEAEWAMFCRRWREHTGMIINQPLYD